MDKDYYTSGEKEFLLKIARQSLENFVLRQETFNPQTINRKLWERRGVFATLTESKKLRGCVGSIEPIESLILAVRDNTIASANDSRFDFVQTYELPLIKIEISILSELVESGFDNIKKGDGVLLKMGEKSATYLPQVWSSFSSKEEFINSLREKAGIGSGETSGEEYFVYNTISFSER